MKLVLFEMEDWQSAAFEEAFPDDEVVCFSDALSEKHYDELVDAEVIGVFIYSQITSDILEISKKLKLIVTLSTGFDHIDIEKASDLGVPVCNVPVYGDNTVAEHTFALLLAVTKKLYESVRRTKAHQKFETDSSLRGIDLNGRSIGVIGCGNIGQNVVRIANGFNMNVMVFDVHQDESLAKKLGFRYVSIDELLKDSDVVSLHVPYNKHTHHLLDESAFNNMTDGVIVLNTSRGQLIDTNAFIKALKSGKVGAAGLDVLEGEGDIKEELEVLTDEFKDHQDLKLMLQSHLLMKMDNVVVTPHNAFNSKEALQRIVDTSINNINSFNVGKPENKVN